MIKIDKEKCIGCGTCSAVCPHNFQMADDGKAEVVSQEESDCVKEAEGMCPTGAISVE